MSSAPDQQGTPAQGTPAQVTPPQVTPTQVAPTQVIPAQVAPAPVAPAPVAPASVAPAQGPSAQTPHGHPPLPFFDSLHPVNPSPPSVVAHQAAVAQQQAPRYGEPNFGVPLRAAIADHGLLRGPEVSYEEWELQNRVDRGDTGVVTLHENDPINPLAGLFGKSVMVAITADTDKEAWHVHEHLLITKSGFFKAALTTGFKEAEEKKVHLHDVDHKTLGSFVEWLYTGDFKSIFHFDLLAAYVFGAKMQADGFRKEAMHKIYESNKRRCQFSAEDLVYVDENVETESGLRKFAIDSICQGLVAGLLTWEIGDWLGIGELSVEINMGVSKLAKKSWPVTLTLPAVGEYLD